MITFNQTQLTDNKLIWLIIIYFDDVTLKLAYKRSVALSGNLYDADVISMGSLSIGEKSINPRFGGLGNLGTLNFSIARNSSNTNVNNFIQDFYPATAGRYAVARVVKLGVVYEGATNENQITYIDTDYYINSFSNDKNNINFQCYEISDIEAINLPYYKVQNEFNNYISYTTKAKESLTMPLPLCYGDFSTNQALDWHWAQRLIKLAPAVMFDESRLLYSYASHNCETALYIPVIDKNSIIFNRSGGWLVVYPAATPGANPELKSYVALTENKVAEEYISASFYLTSGYVIGSKSGITDISTVNANSDEQYTDYFTLADTNVVSFKIDTPLSGLGLPGASASDIRWTIWGNVPEAGDSVVLEVKVFNENKSGGAGYSTPVNITFTNEGYDYGYYDMGDDITGKDGSQLPWTFEELNTIEIVITNVSSTYGDAKDFTFRALTLTVNNILVKAIKVPGVDEMRKFIKHLVDRGYNYKVKKNA